MVQIEQLLVSKMNDDCVLCFPKIKAFNFLTVCTALYPLKNHNIISYEQCTIKIEMNGNI